MKKVVIIACITWIWVTGCTHEEDISVSRTLLVYLAGDNNLSGETDEKLEAIARSWKAEAGHIVVFQDRKGEVPRLIELKENGKFIPVHTYDKEQNSCSADFFGHVIRDVVALYPASDYGLLFFSHATGWLPKGNYPQPATRTIGLDGTDEMGLSDFANAIPDGQFRFIVFEACLMAGVEVAYELKDKTKTIVASSAEILSPGFTGLYAQMIPMLFAVEPKLKELAELYFDYWNGKSGFSRSATISVIQTAGMTRLAELVGMAMENAVEVSPEAVTFFDSGTARLYSDLGEYLELKCTDDALKAMIAMQLQEIVTYRNATPQVMGNPCRSHSGLTVYLPRAGFEKLNNLHDNTCWSKAVYPDGKIQTLTFGQALNDRPNGN